MLNSFRNAANNTVFRLLLGGIILAFIIWGAGDVMRGDQDPAIVKFKNAPNINISEYYSYRKNFLNRLKQFSPTPLSEEKLIEMQVNEQVLDELIDQRMIDEWIKNEEIVISDKTTADYLMLYKEFQNDNGYFDFEKFSQLLQRINITEEEFYSNTKKEITKKLLQNNIYTNAYMPKSLANIITNFLAEQRTIDIMSIDLTQQNSLDAVKPKDTEIEQYYKEHKNSFISPEQRKIHYTVVSLNLFKTESKVTAEEALKYFTENIEEFPKDAKFKDLQSQIIQKLAHDKSEKLLVEFAKELEDEVASGSNLTEIAEKHKFKISSFNGGANEFHANKTLSSFTSTIYDMEKQELSYPLEIPNSDSLILIEIAEVTKGIVPPLPQIKDTITKAFLKEAYTAFNLKHLKEFEAEVKPDNFREKAKGYNFKLIVDQLFTRAELSTDNTWPPQLLLSVFNTAPNSIAPLIVNKDTAYIFKVNNITTDKKRASEIAQSNSESMKQYFKSSFIDEIINYYRQKNQPDIRRELLKKFE